MLMNFMRLPCRIPEGSRPVRLVIAVMDIRVLVDEGCQPTAGNRQVLHPKRQSLQEIPYSLREGMGHERRDMYE